MLNPKILFSEAEKKNEAATFAYFGRDVFFEENDTLQVFRIFLLEGSIH
jgi:hypothetical protein